ncbi:MAG: hypothetical protein GAK41_00254 [Burkholderia gladioli]|nr:MAG: hypothetical protein GAK41_00254 [Burkholderia gladioli]
MKKTISAAGICGRKSDRISGRPDKCASLEFRVGGFFRVKGGRSPAQRTLDAEKSTSTLEASGQAKPCAAWPPSPSGGEDFPALGRG